MIPKITTTLIITLLLLTGLSFLLDLQFIKENWLRYALVLILCLVIVIIGGAVIWEFIKQLKNKG